MAKVIKSKITKTEERVWEEFMTPEYVFTENGEKFVYMEDIGLDKMERLYQIIPIKDAKRILYGV